MNKAEYVKEKQGEYLEDLFTNFHNKVSERDIKSIYKIRDSLIKRVDAHLIEKSFLEKYIEVNESYKKTGLVSTVLYLTAKNFKEMAKATDLAFQQKYGFMAVTGEINEIRRPNQAMFADVNYTEKNSSGFQYATRINELVNSCGNTAEFFEGEVKRGVELRGDVLRMAKGEIGLLENCQDNVAEYFEGKVKRGIGLKDYVLEMAKGEIGLLENCQKSVGKKAKVKYRS